MDGGCEGLNEYVSQKETYHWYPYTTVNDREMLQASDLQTTFFDIATSNANTLIDTDLTNSWLPIAGVRATLLGPIE